MDNPPKTISSDTDTTETPTPTKKSELSSHQSKPNPPKLKHAHKFIYVYMTLIVLAAVAGGIYTWQHNKLTSSSKQITLLNTKVRSLNKQVSSQTKVTKSVSESTTAKPNTETDTLTGGMSISYPLTLANANVVWWSDNGDADSTTAVPAIDYLAVSDKQIVQFLSNIPFDVRQMVCGDDTIDTTAVQMGIYDPSTNTLTLHNQYENCLEAFTLANGNKYQAQAKQITTEATNDLNAWAKSVTVIK